MKFQPAVFRNGWAREITPRRLAAAKRFARRAQEKVALLPDLVAEVEQPEARLEAYRQGEIASHAEYRANRAREWRAHRRAIAALPEHTRRGLMRYWDNWCTNGNPGDPGFLAGFIRQAQTGVSFWAKLRELRQLKLMGEGRLPKDLFFNASTGQPPEPWRRRDYLDRDLSRFRRRRARKLGLERPPERQQFL